MEEMGYLAMMAVVLAVNLLPAFGPPTWSVLAIYGLRGHLAPVPLVALGAASAAAGRSLLALAARRVRGRLAPRRVENLAAARDYLAAHRGHSALALLLAALSPIPSAQLFEAAGLIGVALPPLVGAFFAGRLVSYSIYVGGALALRRTAMGNIVAGSLTGPWGIALQVVLLAGVVALARVNWVRLLERRTEAQKPGRPRGGRGGP